MGIDITPVGRTIGAMVEGVSLAGLGADEAEAVRRAMVDHGVLFLRDQPLTHAEHLALGRCFGPLHHHPTAMAQEVQVPPGLLRIHADERTRHSAGFKWHSDVSCDEEPPMASILTLHTVPSRGGDTLFCDTEAAFDALSAPFQAFLDGLTAVHSGAQVYTGRFGLQPPAGQTFPQAEHPIVRTHPESGRKGLFVNENFTSHIVGLERWESDELLAMLFGHLASPYFQVRFTWEPHSVVIWDNRRVQHLAIWDYHPETRSGWRVTVAGDRPF
jgi:taurine dioxygenase